MCDANSELEKHLKTLFEAAASHDDLQFIYTLIRVSGESYNTPDPFLVLQSRLDALDLAASDEALLSQYRGLAACGAPLELVANLLRCARGEPYDMFPFLHLYRGEFPHKLRPTATEMAEDIALAASNGGRPELSESVRRAYQFELLVGAASAGRAPSNVDVQAALQACATFLASLLRLYSAERLKYREWPRFHKWPRFYVLELLVDDATGLYGVKVHYPSGGSDGLIRRPDSTRCGVADMGPPVRFAMAAYTRPPDEWRVGRKLLYELGLPGRYNELGEWKPISYPGNYEPIKARAEAGSPDPDVQGALFYIMCTAHWVVEFALLAPLELPSQQITFGERFHLYRCPRLQGIPEGRQSLYVYDGWWDLESIDPDAIRFAISEIGLHVSMMTLAYQVSASWQLKYRMRHISRGCASPSEDGLHILDSMLGGLKRTGDAFVLHAAIDWYNRGTSAGNVFTEFLCCYVAIESVALALDEGDADFSVGYMRVPKAQRKQERDECIARKHDELYATDRTRFVQDAYFECVVGLDKKVLRVVELVFGQGHEYVRAVRDKRDGYSLSSMRSAIAHGRLSMRRREDGELVWRRVGEMSRIAREFLMRLALNLGPDAAIPKWPQSAYHGVSGFDPRGFLVASQELLPNKDWRIRPEWFL